MAFVSLSEKVGPYFGIRSEIPSVGAYDVIKNKNLRKNIFPFNDSKKK
jgi:hypothetical protein